MNLRKAAEMALGALEVTADKFQVQRNAITELRQALAQPEQEPVKCMYPYCETASGCDGPCSKPLITPVDAVNMAQERVDETAKHEQEPVAWMHELADGQSYCVTKDESGYVDNFTDTYKTIPLYTAPPKREWVGLTDEERERATGWSVEHIESYLKEKNT